MKRCSNQYLLEFTCRAVHFSVIFQFDIYLFIFEYENVQGIISGHVFIQCLEYNNIDA